MLLLQHSTEIVSPCEAVRSCRGSAAVRHGETDQSTEGMLAVKSTAQWGVQEQAARHNDNAAPHGELIVCLGPSAAVVWSQRGCEGKGC